MGQRLKICQYGTTHLKTTCRCTKPPHVDYIECPTPEQCGYEPRHKEVDHGGEVHETRVVPHRSSPWGID